METLDADADDYVTKPFAVEELLARMRAAVRRSRTQEDLPQLRLGRLTVDLSAKRVSRDAAGGTEAAGDIRLTPTEWHLLEVLLRNPGKLLTRRQLLTEVWGPGYADATGNLRLYMTQLRRKLEPDPARPRWLITEPGMGYRYQPGPDDESPGTDGAGRRIAPDAPAAHHESMRVRGAGRIAGLSPRRRMFHAGTSLAVAAIAILTGLQAAGAFAGPTTGLNTSKPGAVLLVPGYGGNTGALETLAARIRDLGRTAVVVRLPGNGTGDLAAQAAVLNGYVDRELQRLGAPVDVIGYSAGGVVARLWDVQDGGAQKARRIITLGAPLHGTAIAAAGNAAFSGACPAACRELVPGSTLLTQLTKSPFTGRPSWLSLWSVDDLVVWPPTSALLPGAVNLPLQSVCPGAVIQHGQLPTDPLAVGIVLRSLRPGPLIVPGFADCASLQALGSADVDERR